MEPQQTTPTVPPPIVEQKPASSNRMFKVVLLVFLVLLLGSVVTYAFQNYQPQQVELPPAPEPPISPTSTPTEVDSSVIPDETGEFMVYTNTKYNFSFKFPRDWSIATGYDVRNQPIVEITKGQNNISFGGIWATDQQPTKTENFIFGGIQMKKLIFQNGDNKIYMFTLDGTKGINVNAIIDTKSIDYESTLKEIDQILSSFRFVEGEKVQVPANWITIDTGSYSLQAPPTWKYTKLQGVDSFVGEFVGDGVKLTFDYGWYSNPLDGYVEPDYRIDYKSIDSRQAKIVVPNKKGGTIGVYFENVKSSSDEPPPTTKLQISGPLEDLDKAETVLLIFDTITFEQL